MVCVPLCGSHRARLCEHCAVSALLGTAIGQGVGGPRSDVGGRGQSGPGAPDGWLGGMQRRGRRPGRRRRQQQAQAHHQLSKLSCAVFLLVFVAVLCSTMVGVRAGRRRARSSPAAPAPTRTVNAFLSSNPRRRGLKSMATVYFCVNCPHPHEEGSMVNALKSAQGPQEYGVGAALHYAVPNNGSSKLANREEIAGKIAVLDRGEVPLSEKVRRAQDAGAVGVIIVDDGTCDRNFHRCGYRAGSVTAGGFAPFDNYVAWRDVEIPSLLLHADDGKRLRELLPLEEIEIPRFGKQFVNRIS